MQLPVPGDLFSGHYRIESILGKGGFATVFAATDVRTGDTIALKILRPEEAAGYARETRARFDREVRILRELTHPHIIDELDAGQSDDGLLFVAFELLPGRDLADVLGKGRLSPVLVTSVLRQLLSALEAAHAVGLLHRDLKPQNIRVVEEHPDHLRVKLLDFGIARGTDDGHPAITKTGELIGTPRYMSPEQLRGVSLGPPSDIYSLGLLVFELLMGREALAGNTIFDQIERMTSGHLMSVPELERANPALLAIIQRMTLRAPQKRFQSAREVLAALDSLGASGGYAGAAPPSTASIAFEPTFESPDAPRPTSVDPRMGTSKPKRTAVLPVVLGLLLLAVGAGAFVILRTPNDDAAVPATTASPNVRATPTARPRATPPASRHDAGSEPVADAADVRSLDGADPSEGCKALAPFHGPGTIHQVLPAYIPKRYAPNRAHPVVILLHDVDRPASELILDTDFDDLADAHDLVLLAPYRGAKWDEPAQVVPFIRSQLEIAERQLCIDRSRVFAVSHGRGGRAAAPLACVDWITAIALNAFNFRRDREGDGSLDLERMFCADVPKPALLVWPTHSAAVPINGEQGCADRRVNFSLSETRVLWKDRNGCNGAPRETVVLPGGTCETWACERAFVSCEVSGGYPWPGTSTQRGRPLKCPIEPAPDFPTARVMWDFFSSVEPLPARDKSAD